LSWIASFVIIVPLVVAVVWEVWESCIRVSRLPAREIVSLARELRQKHGIRAAEIAFINEDRAWRYSDSFERGKWRRVKRHLQKPNFALEAKSA
jgi:hypothetical protein